MDIQSFGFISQIVGNTPNVHPCLPNLCEDGIHGREADKSEEWAWGIMGKRFLSSGHVQPTVENCCPVAVLRNGGVRAVIFPSKSNKGNTLCCILLVVRGISIPWHR